MDYQTKVQRLSEKIVITKIFSIETSFDYWQTVNSFKKEISPLARSFKIKGEGKEWINLRCYVEGTLEASMELVIGWRQGLSFSSVGQQVGAQMR